MDAVVLVVDDDPVWLRLTRERLVEAGFSRDQLRVADCVDDARLAIDREWIDVVFVDHRLGSQSGLHFGSDLLSLDPDFPVILLSARVDLRLEEAAAAAGFADLMRKDRADGPAMRRAVRHGLRRRGDRRALRDSAARYSAMAHSLPDAGVLTCDSALNITTIDGNLYRDVGLDAGRLIGTDLRAALHTFQMADHIALYEAALLGERRQIQQQGPRERVYLVNFGPLRGPGDEVIGAMSVAIDVSERQQIEREHSQARRAAATARQREQLVIANLPGTVVALYDRDLRVINVDGLDGKGDWFAPEGVPAMRSPEAARSAHVSEFFSPEEYARLHPYLLGALDGRRASVEHEGGQGRHWRGDFSPYVEDGETAGVLAIWHEVTAAKAAERELVERGRQLAEAQALALVGSWDWPSEAQAPTWSDELCRIFGQPLGYSPTPDGFLDLVYEPDRDRVRQMLATALPVEHADRESSYRIVRPGGEVRWVQSRRHTRVSDGSTRSYGTIQDVTDQRVIGLELAERERQFRALATQMPAGVVQRNAAGEVVFANDHAFEMFGLPVGSPLRSLNAGFVHSDDREAAQVAANRATSTGASYAHEQRIVTVDGCVRWVMVNGSRQVNEAGEVVGHLGTFVDVTDQRNQREALQQSEELHRLTISNLPGAVVGLYDSDLVCQLMQGQSVSQTPLTTSVCRGKRLWQFARQEVADDLEPLMLRALEGETIELDYPRHDEGMSHFTVAPFRGPGGEISGVVIVSADITEQHRAQAAERQASEQLRVAFDQAPIGNVLVGLDGRFSKVNQALCDITGYSEQELLAQAPFSIVHVDDLGNVQLRFADLGSDGATVAIEHRIVHAQGHARWVDARVTLVRGADGQPSHALAQIQDITERRSYEHQLQHMALHDPLTGLLNRRGLEERLEQQMAHVERYGDAGCLLMIDLDGFKLVNDTLGHATGDELIIGVATTITRRLRETDTIARLGGDEFAVILPVEKQPEGLLVARDLVDLIRQHAATLDGQHPGQVTASIGVVEFRQGCTAQEMLIRGDLAMYEAKDAGKNQAAPYTTDEHPTPRVQAQLTWIERITDAINRDRFVLYAQPIIDLQSNQTDFHEVLLRMLDDHGDLIPPATFLYIAERFGLSAKLDAWVINHALDAMTSERTHGRDLPLSINISGASAGDAEITELLRRRITAGQINPKDLILELTETAAVADMPRARAFAETIKSLGVRLALDDFGAGFGSFYYVKHLPFDILKLDGEYIQNATQNATDREIIASIATLARGLGKQTIGEFIPNDETIRLLLKQGVDMGQGYHLGKPQPLNDILTDIAAEYDTDVHRRSGAPSRHQ